MLHPCRLFKEFLAFYCLFWNPERSRSILVCSQACFHGSGLSFASYLDRCLRWSDLDVCRYVFNQSIALLDLFFLSIEAQSFTWTQVRLDGGLSVAYSNYKWTPSLLRSYPDWASYLTLFQLSQFFIIFTYFAENSLFPRGLPDVRSEGFMFTDISMLSKKASHWWRRSSCAP